MLIAHVSGCEDHDLTKPIAIMAAILAVWSLNFGALVHLAPVCSSFVWINLATHERDRVLPLGADLPHVATGNALLERSVLLAVLSFWRGAVFTLEQPRGSRLEMHPLVQWLIEYLESHGAPLYRQPLSLGDFGSVSQKPIWIYGLHEDMDLTPVEVILPETDEVATASASCPVTYKNLACTVASKEQVPRKPLLKHRYTGDDGRTRVSGGPGLKQTQSYPKMLLGSEYTTSMSFILLVVRFRFGKSVAQWFAQNHNKMRSQGTGSW